MVGSCALAPQLTGCRSRSLGAASHVLRSGAWKVVLADELSHRSPLYDGPAPAKRMGTLTLLQAENCLRPRNRPLA